MELLITNSSNGSLVITFAYFFPIGEQTGNYRIAKWHEASSSFDVCSDGINDVLHIIIGDIRTGRQTQSHFKQSFRYPIHIRRDILVARLLMHWLPYWSCLYLSLIERNTHSLHIGIGFTVSMSRLCYMDHTCSTPDSTRHDGLIGILLTLHLNVLIYSDGTQPVVTIIVTIIGLRVYMYSW